MAFDSVVYLRVRFAIIFFILRKKVISFRAFRAQRKAKIQRNRSALPSTSHFVIGFIHLFILCVQRATWCDMVCRSHDILLSLFAYMHWENRLVFVFGYKMETIHIL